MSTVYVHLVLKLFTWCDGYECDLLCIHTARSHIVIVQKRYETHSMCDIAHTSVHILGYNNCSQFVTVS